MASYDDVIKVLEASKVSDIKRVVSFFDLAFSSKKNMIDSIKKEIGFKYDYFLSIKKLFLCEKLNDKIISILECDHE